MGDGGTCYSLAFQALAEKVRRAGSITAGQRDTQVQEKIRPLLLQGACLLSQLKTCLLEDLSSAATEDLSSVAPEDPLL